MSAGQPDTGQSDTGQSDTGEPETGLLLGFVGWADPDRADAAHRYEDEVLALLDRHGAQVRFRGRRAAGESGELPVEMHVLWFPGQGSFDAYLSDPARLRLLDTHGEVFTVKTVVRLTDHTSTVPHPE